MISIKFLLLFNSKYFNRVNDSKSHTTNKIIKIWNNDGESVQFSHRYRYRNSVYFNCCAVCGSIQTYLQYNSMYIYTCITSTSTRTMNGTRYATCKTCEIFQSVFSAFSVLIVWKFYFSVFGVYCFVFFVQYGQKTVWKWTKAFPTYIALTQAYLVLSKKAVEYVHEKRYIFENEIRCKKCGFPLLLQEWETERRKAFVARSKHTSYTLKASHRCLITLQYYIDPKSLEKAKKPTTVTKITESLVIRTYSIFGNTNELTTVECQYAFFHWVHRICVFVCSLNWITYAYRSMLY